MFSLGQYLLDQRTRIDDQGRKVVFPFGRSIPGRIISDEQIEKRSLDFMRRRAKLLIGLSLLFVVLVFLVPSLYGHNARYFVFLGWALVAILWSLYDIPAFGRIFKTCEISHLQLAEGDNFPRSRVLFDSKVFVWALAVCTGLWFSACLFLLVVSPSQYSTIATIVIGAAWTVSMFLLVRCYRRNNAA